MEKINEITNKADYCMQCKTKPCSNKGCPLNNNIPEFINMIKEEKYEEAYKILCETTVLPGICGRICPHMKQCQGTCVRGIKGESVSIGELEAFVYDIVKEKRYTLKDGFESIKEKYEGISDKKVAIVGGGPCGLTAAAFLTKEGVKVTIYERYDYLGGLLMYGIPEFRLEKDTVSKTINDILNLGIEVKYNQELGKNLSLEKLRKEYDTVFLSFGGNVSSKMGVEGENLEGVYGANELLEYNTHPDYTGKIVSIVGGGNVAMDCARTIKRLGAKEVKVIYRRAREQMPAEDKEIEDAIKDGVEFLYQNNIVKIFGNNKVERVELIKTELRQKDGEKRPVPVNIENSNYIIDVDYIVMALGSKPADFALKLGLDLDKWGNIKIDENYRTSCKNIYAGGDIAGGKKTVAWASYSGREAAKKIIEDLKNYKYMRK